MGIVYLVILGTTNVRLTHPATWAKIRLLITILSFGEIICSLSKVRPEFIERGEPKIKGIGDITTSADQTTNAPLGQSDWPKVQDEDLNKMLPDLDTRTIQLAMEQQEKGSFFWTKNLYHPNVDKERIKLDPRGEKLDEIEKEDIIQSVRMEYLLLKKMSWSCRKKLLGIKMIGEKTENAHEILEDIIENHTIMILGLFGEKIDELTGEQKNSLVGKAPEDIKWNILIHHFQNQLTEFEDLFPQLKLTKIHSHYEKMGRSIFIAHMFKIINCLVKYKLIEESFFKIWINNPKSLSLLADHIIKSMYDNSAFLTTDIREGLYKSKLSQHLVPSLDSLSEKSWKFIEAKSLYKKTKYLMTLEEKYRPNKFVIKFSFGLQDIDKSEDENEESTAIFIKLIQQLISYFERTPYFERFPNFGRSINNYHTYGLLYQMIQFIMRYYPYELTQALKNEEHARSFSIKIHILELALKVLKSSSRVEFVGHSGYWTTEEDSWNSKHLISFEQIKNWDFVPDLENKYLMERFSGDLPGERNEMTEKFKQFSLARDGSEGKQLFCFDNVYQFESLPERLGTNFPIIPKGFKKLHKGPNKNPTEKKISTLFLRDSYSWIQKLKFFLKKFRMEQDLYSEIMKWVLSCNEEMIPQDVKDWINNGKMMRTVNYQITDSIEAVEYLWIKFKARLGSLNQEILKPSSFQNDLIQNLLSSKEEGESSSDVLNTIMGIDPSSINTAQKLHPQVKGLLYIPGLDFSIKAPISSIEW